MPRKPSDTVPIQVFLPPHLHRELRIAAVTVGEPMNVYALGILSAALCPENSPALVKAVARRKVRK